MSILMTPKHTHARKHTSARARTHKEIGKIPETSNPNDDWFVHWNTLGQQCLYRTFWSTLLVVTNDSIRGCVRPCVRPSVSLSVCPSIRPSVGNTNFWLAKKGQKWAKMRSAMTRRAEIRRVTTYFMNTILFSRQTTYFMYINLLLLTQLLQNWKGINVLRGWRQAVSLPSHGVNRDLSQKRQNVSVSPPAQARCINSTRKSKFTPCDSATFLLFQKNKAGYTNRH